MKSSGELSSVPYPTTVSIPFTHSFPPPIPSRVVGRPPTLSSEALSRRYTAPSASVKVLARMTVIYIAVTPWFVKNLPFSPSRTPELAPRDGSFSFLLPLWHPSSLWTSAFGLRLLSRSYFRLLPQEKFLQDMRLAMADKLLSPFFVEGLQVTSLTFFIFSLSFPSHILPRFFFQDLFP